GRGRAGPVTPWSAAGTVSATAAPVALLGPALVTVIWYVTGRPGTAVACESVLLAARSAWGVRVSSSVARLSPRFGSVMPGNAEAPALLVSTPVADGLTVP